MIKRQTYTMYKYNFVFLCLSSQLQLTLSFHNSLLLFHNYCFYHNFMINPCLLDNGSTYVIYHWVHTVASIYLYKDSKF